MRGQVTGIHRAVAVLLACVRLGAGSATLLLGAQRAKIGVVIVAALAIGYAVLWLRVLARMAPSLTRTRDDVAAG